MEKLSILKPGDCVEIIAPASRCSDSLLSGLKELVTSWNLHCLIDKNIFGDDLLCANTDEARFHSLKSALLNTDTQAIICARGGYGSMRLIPELAKVAPPACSKLFIGMSDITALSLYLQQQWKWPSIHGALALDKFTKESITRLKSILFGDVNEIVFQGQPLNALAQKNFSIETFISGGNLCLVQSSIGTLWQIKGQNNIIFLEEIGERGYRIDRMLEHLQQVSIFKEAAAIVFGDFIEGNEPDGSSLINPVLARFAEQCSVPVVQIAGVGHGRDNFPLFLGTKSLLQLGDNIQLTCYR